MDLEKLGWLKASEYRKSVLSSLSDGPMTPKEISEDTSYYLSHVSNTLSELSDHDLVECATPERQKGKIYIITEEGKKIQGEI